MTNRQAMGQGKTIEDAIEDALAKLGAKRNEVDVEITQAPSKGLFSFRGKPAQVVVTLREQSTPQPVAGVGTAAVVNGRLEYVPPQPGGSQPIIQFRSDIKVYYRGDEVLGELVLTEGLDHLEIILPEDVEPELHYDVIVSPDKTKAQLVWKRTPGVVHKLMDQAPRNRLVLQVIKEAVEAPVLSLQQVQEIAEVSGLNYGLRLDELTPEILDASQGAFDLAVGIPPKPGRDASIKYVFQDEGADPELDDAIRVDHFAVHGTEGVTQGAVLAVKEPAQPGVPGRDVYGQEIKPAPVRDVEIRVGEGAQLSEDGLQAIASVPGIAFLQGGIIRVKEVFELPGDADVSTGNITMEGDIIIRGNVLEQVRVQSNSGAIVIHGLVSGATVRTRGSITVIRNVVRSQLYAGGASVSRMRLVNMLQKIADQLEGLIVASESIVSQAEHLSFENLIRHLIELKFSDLPKQIKAVTHFVEEMEDPAFEEADALSAALDDTLLSTDALFATSIEGLREYRQAVLSSVDRIENMGILESDIKAGYLQNSRVEASGAVTITGQGCFYSTVLAGTGFNAPVGLFRGGSVTVESGTIAAKEFGGPTGIATKASLLKSGRITASLVHPNVVFSIGDQLYKFDESTPQVKGYLHEGILTIYSGSLKIHG